MTDDRVRTVADLSELKALTHPVRVKLLSALTVQGQLTATEAAKIVAESPTTCSFHFRQLERFGFVERAGDKGRRTQPWKLASTSLHVPLGIDFDLDGRATQALGESLLQYQLEQHHDWESERTSWDPAWQAAADQSQYVLWVTAEELTETVKEVRTLLSRYRERLTDPSRRPAGASPAQVITLAHPLPGRGGTVQRPEDLISERIEPGSDSGPSDHE